MGAARRRNLAAAERWFTWACSVSLTPTAITYSTLINAAARAADLAAAEKWLAEMRSARCPPDLKTMASLMGGHLQHGELQTAISCLDRMEDLRVSADARIYEQILCSCRHTWPRPVDLTERVFRRLLASKSLNPTTTILAAVTRVLGERRLAELLVESH